MNPRQRSRFALVPARTPSRTSTRPRHAFGSTLFDQAVKTIGWRLSALRHPQRPSSASCRRQSLLQSFDENTLIVFPITPFPPGLRGSGIQPFTYRMATRAGPERRPHDDRARTSSAQGTQRDTIRDTADKVRIAKRSSRRTTGEGRSRSPVELVQLDSQGRDMARRHRRRVDERHAVHNDARASASVRRGTSRARADIAALTHSAHPDLTIRQLPIRWKILGSGCSRIRSFVL